MSRDLPPRPHLDHLKKQAKLLLQQMRRQQAGATLADAQRAVARDYGFASWAQLKAHVGTVLEHQQNGTIATDGDGRRGGSGDGDRGGVPASGPPPRGPLFDRFTEATKKAVFFSRYEASKLGQLRIVPDHVLLGVIRAASGACVSLLTAARVTLDEARAMAAAARYEPLGESGEIPFMPATKDLFAAAAAAADDLGHTNIGTIHLVLALLRQPGGAADYLNAKGLTFSVVRAAAHRAGEDELT